MLTTEWNMDTALEVRYDEGRREGLREGRSEGHREGRSEERTMRDSQWETWISDIDLTPEQKRKLEAKRGASE